MGSGGWDKLKSYDEAIAEAQASLTQPGETYLGNGLTVSTGLKEATEAEYKAKFAAQGYTSIRFNWDKVVNGFGDVVSGYEYAKKEALISNNGACGCSIFGKKK